MKLFYQIPLLCYTSIIFTSLLSSVENSHHTEKNIAIIIPSYNNKNWYIRNIESALSQNYSHFRIIYTDDCSPDGTGDLVEAYLAHHDLGEKITLIKNKTRRGALHNLYTMIHACEDDEIIVTLDGDDWLPDNDVLTRLNEIYSANEVWLTYGQFQMHPSKTVGWASPMPDYIIENSAFRDFQHLPTHLRTFYAWLFKKIKLEDLLYQGAFYPMTWDMAMMFPMIEMASERHQFIADIMYIYNDENSISDHHVSRQLQAHLAQIIKKKKRYKRLTEKPHTITKTNAVLADAIVFAQSPTSLTQLLESFTAYVDGIDHIFVMYRPTSYTEEIDYKNIQALYPAIELYLISDHRSNFKDTLFELYQKTNNDYILFAKGDSAFQKPLSLHSCINALKNIDAYAFYFKLNAQDGINAYENLPIVECSNNIYAWNFSLARDKWSSANSVDLVLHKKTESLNAVLQSHYDLTPNGLEMVWANEGNLDRFGLCFDKSYVKKIE